MKRLVPSKKSKHFGFLGDILKIILNPSNLRNNYYWCTETEVLEFHYDYNVKIHTILFFEMDKKLKSYPSWSMFLKKHEHKQNLKNSNLYVANSKILSTMYEKCKKNFIPPFIFWFFLFHKLCFNSSTTHKIYLSITKNQKPFGI